MDRTSRIVKALKFYTCPKQISGYRPAPAFCDVFPISFTKLPFWSRFSISEFPALKSSRSTETFALRTRKTNFSTIENLAIAGSLSYQILLPCFREIVITYISLAFIFCIPLIGIFLQFYAYTGLHRGIYAMLVIVIIRPQSSAVESVRRKFPTSLSSWNVQLLRHSASFRQSLYHKHIIFVLNHFFSIARN